MHSLSVTTNAIKNYLCYYIYPQASVFLVRPFCSRQCGHRAPTRQLFSWSIRLRSGAWSVDTKALQWTPTDVEHCLRLCLNYQHQGTCANMMEKLVYMPVHKSHPYFYYNDHRHASTIFHYYCSFPDPKHPTQ